MAGTLLSFLLICWLRFLPMGHFWFSSPFSLPDLPGLKDRKLQGKCCNFLRANTSWVCWLHSSANSLKTFFKILQNKCFSFTTAEVGIQQCTGETWRMMQGTIISVGACGLLGCMGRSGSLLPAGGYCTQLVTWAEWAWAEWSLARPPKDTWEGGYHINLSPPLVCMGPVPGH